MKPSPTWLWAILTFIFAVLLAYVLIISTHDAEGETQQQCIDNETRERIRALSLEGYDRALRDHSANLFKIWVQDDHDQPKRATVGTQQGISAYVRARALALKWNPPPCN